MFKNLSIRGLLTWALGVIFVLFLAIGIAGYKTLDGHRTDIQELLDNNVVRGDQAHRLASDLLRARLAAVNAIATMKDGDIEGAKTVAQRALPYNTRADAYIARLKATPDTSTEGAPLYADMMNAYQTYRQEAYDPMIAAALAGDLQKTTALNDQKVTPLGTVFTKALLAYVDYTSRIGEEISNKAAADVTRSVIIMQFGGLVVVALIVSLFILFNRRVFTPLREVTRIFERIASGDLTGRIAATSRNEIGVLVDALKRMQDSLVRTVTGIRTGAETISLGSNEIAAGNADLSSRTEEQAASLEETAASMEEMASTVKQNADNARQANQLAASASEVAQRGGAAVAEVVETMSAISGSSKKISEIVSVIDGIAFQTNILALNAAVEAARAGEQGKGFAVVAGEVRSLAQRSSTAAKEIKDLIEDSASKVNVGASQVERAGTTMQEIVTSVKRVTDIMGEITTASDEQARGVDQVNTAISQMDEVTQQNAALVEESAAAAGAMQDQVTELVRAVAAFKTHSNQVIDVTPVAQPHLEEARPASRVARAPAAGSPAAGSPAAGSPAAGSPAAGSQASKTKLQAPSTAAAAKAPPAGKGGDKSAKKADSADDDWTSF
ncbi:methyl-accepting chemotaxis protein [Pseudomonadota bacterium AL_CKDN230030165-1A_HGKHYDSX7]